MTQKRLALIFVVDGHRLEICASFLASTIHQYCGARDDLDVIAYVKSSHLNTLPPILYHVFERYGVRVEALSLEPLVEWAEPYPHGNKILACAEARESTRTLFLDSDMLINGPIDALFELEGNQVGVVPVDALKWGKNLDDWGIAYQHFDMDVPHERITTSYTRKETVPFFNAGMISFPEQISPEGGEQFGAGWLDTALSIDHNCDIRPKRPWLDQLALPIAMKRFGVSYEILDMKYNFPAHLNSIEGKEHEISIVHYHHFPRVNHTSLWQARYTQLIEDTPKVLQNDIISFLKSAQPN